MDLNLILNENIYLLQIKLFLLCFHDTSFFHCSYNKNRLHLGLSPTKLTSALQFLKEKRSGRIYTNDYLQVLVDEKIAVNNMFALGDCATPIARSLPATAQAAVQQAKYLAHRMNEKDFYLKDPKTITNDNYPVFIFNNRGMLAYLGGYGGVADLKSAKATGFSSWLIWRSVYITRLVSFKNRLLV